MKKYDAIIVGAGAAGLLCASRAAQRGRSVLLLDRAEKAGQKILISGGGRCNFTNLFVSPDKFISQNPHFCRSALASFTAADFIKMVEKHNIPFYEKTLGQLFCSRSAEDILQMLLSECLAHNVDIGLNQKISEITKNETFNVTTDIGSFEATSLVVATGGLSIPKLGATDFAYRLAEQFKLPLISPDPALVPLVFAGEMQIFMENLAGTSLTVAASSGSQAFTEGMVFTHRGLSGPAILQISSYWQGGGSLMLDLLPEIDFETYLLEQKNSRARSDFKAILGELLPKKLANALASLYFTSMHNLGGLSDLHLKEAALLIKGWNLFPSGSEGFVKAEVTKGGIDTRALSSKTMEVKAVPGLYFIGEALDVTGWLGGYNFQWAWSSGYAAGSAI